MFEAFRAEVVSESNSIYKKTNPKKAKTNPKKAIAMVHGKRHFQFQKTPVATIGIIAIEKEKCCASD